MRTLLRARMAKDVLEALFDEVSDVERDFARETAESAFQWSGVCEVGERFTNRLKHLIDFELASINLIDEVNGTTTVAYLSKTNGPLPCHVRTIPLAGTAEELIVEGHRSLIIGDPGEDHQASSMRFLPEAGLRSFMLVPLISREKVMATFSLASGRPNAFGQREKLIMERLAPYVTAAFENPLGYQELKNSGLALESMTDAVALVGPQGDIQWVNRAFEEMFGYDIGELVGKPCTTVLPSFPGGQPGRL